MAGHGSSSSTGRADERRDRLLEESGLAPRADEDRDEYPPAVGRPNGNQKGLVRGIIG